MKKTFHIPAFVFAFVLFANTGMAQSACYITNDTILASQNIVGNYHNYYYDGQNRLIRAEKVDSLGLVLHFDSLFYNGLGQHTRLDDYIWDGSTYKLYHSLAITYTAGKVTRLDASGTNAGAYTISHDINYDLNGNMQSAVVDTTVLTGTPFGFTGSVINMSWANGNMDTAVVVFGPYVWEIRSTYDNKNNILKKIFFFDVDDFMYYSNANNVLQIRLINNEAIGVAGTAVLNRAYTYNSNNDVDVFVQVPTVFDSLSVTLQFFYNCGLGIENAPGEEVIKTMYPNPATGNLHIATALQGSKAVQYQIINAVGAAVAANKTDQQEFIVDISTLPTGIYFIRLQSGNAKTVKRFVKE